MFVSVLERCRVEGTLIPKTECYVSLYISRFALVDFCLTSYDERPRCERPAVNSR